MLNLLASENSLAGLIDKLMTFSPEEKRAIVIMGASLLQRLMGPCISERLPLGRAAKRGEKKKEGRQREREREHFQTR